MGEPKRDLSCVSIQGLCVFEGHLYDSAAARPIPIICMPGFFVSQFKIKKNIFNMAQVKSAAVLHLQLHLHISWSLFRYMRKCT